MASHTNLRSMFILNDTPQPADIIPEKSLNLLLHRLVRGQAVQVVFVRRQRRIAVGKDTIQGKFLHLKATMDDQFLVEGVQLLGFEDCFGVSDFGKDVQICDEDFLSGLWRGGILLFRLGLLDTIFAPDKVEESAHNVTVLRFEYPVEF